MEKGNTLQTAASQPHGGIALYRDILANVLISDGKVSDNTQSSQGKDKKVAENQATSGDAVKNAESPSRDADKQKGATLPISRSAILSVITTTRSCTASRSIQRTEFLPSPCSMRKAMK